MKHWLAIGFATLVTACAWLPTERTGIVVPDTDERLYRHIELENGLSVVLVSDADADKAAASLDVRVGSRQDPAEWEGLAHFLEHMLFLGTEAYPEPGEYQAFIAANGGSHNAYTAFEHTNYFFDIEPAQLAAALDRFSAFFQSPLFNPEYVSREVNAVHSEYRARINNDRRRVMDVFKEVVNPEHPFASFSVGSLDTLLDSGEEALRQALLDFYAQWYSADIMSLTVLGRESLGELEAMVRQRFAEVPDRDVKLQAISEPLFSEQQLPMWVNIKPEQELRELSISFPLPDLSEHYRTSPLNYIGNLIGHEGEGSLLSLLKALGWAESLSAGGGLRYDGGTLFSIDIELTEAGLKNVDELVALVFDTIDHIEAGGIERWRYLEQTRVGQQQFRFRSPRRPVEEVTMLANAQHDYDIEDLIRGPYLMVDFDRDLIASLLAQMTPDRAMFYLLEPGVQTDRRSRFYDTPYGFRQLPEATLNAWLKPDVDQAIRLPAENPFIASDLKLKKRASNAPPQPSRLAAADVETWWLQDARFDLPKSSIYLLLQSPELAENPDAAAKSALWVRMVVDQLNEYAYPATLAGLHFGLSSGWRGIELQISGFDQRQGRLLQTILPALMNPQWDQARFERLKAESLRDLLNQKKREPFRRLQAEIPAVLQERRYTLDQRIESMRSVSLKGMQQHVLSSRDGWQPRLLVHGNFRAAEAREIASLVADSVLPKSAPDQPVSRRVLSLPEGDRLLPLEDPHTDSALYLYWQAPGLSKRDRAIFGLAAQILRAEFYSSLRTEKQLGYIVSAWPQPIDDVAGLVLAVQSPVADAETLRQEFLAFMDAWVMQPRSPAFFARNQQALIARLLEEPSNLWDAGDRLWRDLLQGYEGFDSRQQLADELAALDVDVWQQRLQELWRQPRRALWLATPGQWQRWPDIDQVIESVPDLKRDAEWISIEKHVN